MISRNKIPRMCHWRHPPPITWITIGENHILYYSYSIMKVITSKISYIKLTISSCWDFKANFNWFINSQPVCKRVKIGFLIIFYTLEGSQHWVSGLLSKQEKCLLSCVEKKLWMLTSNLDLEIDILWEGIRYMVERRKSPIKVEEICKREVSRKP